MPKKATLAPTIRKMNGKMREKKNTILGDTCFDDDDDDVFIFLLSFQAIEYSTWRRNYFLIGRVRGFQGA
jgi:hypothetical protein